MLDSVPRAVSTPMESALGRVTMRKASARILPLLGLGYLVAYLDRYNVSFAALQMNVDLGFNATIYGLGAGLFFLSYALFEVPSNAFLARVGARRWIARIMITWGLIASGMMFVRTPMQFYVMRFLLGMAEAGFLPGVIFYLSRWFPSAYRGRAISRFYVAAPIAGMLMGVISGGLLSLDGTYGLRGWQWLFLLQGLPAVCVAVLVLRFLPDSPDSAEWLNADERSWIKHELAREAEAIGQPAAHGFFAALSHPIVLWLGVFGLLTIGANVTFTLSVPQILHEQTQFDSMRIGRIVSAANTLGAVSMLLCGVWSDRRGERWSIMLGSTGLLVVALGAMAIVLGTAVPLLVIAMYFVCKIVFSFVSSSSVMLWPDVLHPRLLAVGAAAMNTLSQVGGFAMPFAWGVAKDATGSFRVGLLGLAAAVLVAWSVAYSVAHRTRMRAA